MTSLILAFALFHPLHIAEAQNLLDTSIRTVNWDSILALDTAHFLTDSANSENYLGPYYKVLHDPQKGGGYFYPSWAKPIYADINKDGLEDAAIALLNPGSGGYGTCLVFVQTREGPKFCGSTSGGHFLDTLIDDTLIVETAHWLDQDPNCCERAHDIQNIVGDGDTVRFLPLRIEPESGSAYVTVSYFYAALSGDQGYTMPDSMTNQEYAYSMLSKSYRRAHPYKEWLKGYAHTLSVDADVDKNSPDSSVRVKITSVDTINGQLVTKHFAGIWRMIFVTNNRPDGAPTAIAGWFLDQPEIREVK